MSRSLYFRQCTDCSLVCRWNVVAVYVMGVGTFQWFACEKHATNVSAERVACLNEAQQAAHALGAKVFYVHPLEPWLKKIEEQVLAEDAARRFGG